MTAENNAETLEFLDRNKVGLLMRTFATKSEDIPKRVEMVKKLVDKTTEFSIDHRLVFKQTDVLVWKDPRHKDSDCGETASALMAAGLPARITEMDGDLFCSMMNTGVTRQIRAGMDYTTIISPDAHAYATPETLTNMITAAARGADVVGVAIDELTDSILRGRVANTFAMWHNESLMGVGGFDMTSAKPTSDQLADYYRGFVGDKTVFYQKAGVEEMIPLARIFDRRSNQPFIAPIIPHGEGVKKYELPTDPELLARHLAKMATKFDRQQWMLMSKGYDFSWLEAAVMPEYKQF